MNTDIAVNNLKQTVVWRYLNEINEDYANRAISFLEGISPVLDTIVDYFPYYTRHDAVHGGEVLKRISQIVMPECFIHDNPLALSAQETYLLIASAYAHDLGMAVFPGEEEKLRNEFELSNDDSWKHSPKLSRFLRDNHSTRGLSYIQQYATDLRVPQNLISILGDMMRAHNLSIHELEVQLSKRTAAGEQEIDLKQLSCILCIADALEFSDTRVIDGVVEKLRGEVGKDERVSYRENMKHVCIGDSVGIGEDGRVIFSGTFTEEEVMALAHRTIDLTEDWVRQYCDIEENASKKRLRIKADAFIRNLELPGVDYERLGIRIKKENIINLISSNATWSNDVAVPVRELLQNAVEACRYRQFHTPSNRGYQPKIDVIFDRENHLITVQDNGCGMSKNVILNNFLTVGNSRSEDPTYLSHGYNSLSRFGIGFWSVFTISTEASIETAAFEHLELYQPPEAQVNGLKFEVNIDNFKDYTVFIPNVQSAGTTINLKIKPEVEMDAIFVAIQRQVICSEFPINLIVLNERILNLPKSPTPLNSEELFGSRIAKAKENNVQVFNWTSNKENLEVALTISFRKEESGNLTFLMKDNQNSMLGLFPHINQPIISVCGFVVPLQLGSIAWDIGRIGQVSVNLTDPRGIKYRLDRRSLLPSQEQDNASMIANELIHEGYREFLKNQGCYQPKIIYYLNRQSRMNGGEVFDSYTKKRLITVQKNYQDLCCFKFIKVSKGTDFENAERSYVSLKDLVHMVSSRVVVCQHSKSLIPNRWFDSESLLPIVYEIQKNKLDHIPTYIMEPISEASMLFDNSKEANIFVQRVRLSQDILDLLMMEMLLTGMEAKQHPWVIAEVSGKWSGTIYERPIISSNINENFLFLGRYRLVVQAESRLANVIKELVADGRTYAVTELVVKLEEASNGHVDPKFLEDWPELVQ